MSPALAVARASRGVRRLMSSMASVSVSRARKPRLVSGRPSQGRWNGNSRSPIRTSAVRRGGDAHGGFSIEMVRVANDPAGSVDGHPAGRRRSRSACRRDSHLEAGTSGRIQSGRGGSSWKEHPTRRCDASCFVKASCAVGTRSSWEIGLDLEGERNARWMHRLQRDKAGRILSQMI